VTARLPDVEAFAGRLREGVLEPGGKGAIFVSRAPGRLDVMGGIADYSGALVLQWPIREATRIALQRRPDPVLHIVSQGRDGQRRQLEVPLEIVADPARSYDQARCWFNSDTSRHWAAYIAGVFHVLVHEHDARFADGATIVVESDVPEGKGVSSSAALEAATMEAVLAAWQLHVPPRIRAIRCQQVENLIVGAPCGVMDQMASICGEAESLMALLCQPAEFQGTIALPSELAVWGIDSGIRHAVTGADYGAVRVGAFMGYRVLADLAGFDVSPGDRDGHVRVTDPRWGGYLANVGSDAFLELEHLVPGTLNGGTFLSRYGGTTDPVTRVDRERTYAVWKPTAHPIYEHERVSEWASLLRSVGNDGSAALTPIASRLGELMYQSHASYSACGLGSDGTDRLVAMVRQIGPAAGLYGAKITGGGSGGTVAILGDRRSGDRVREIARVYSAETGRDVHVFDGSSPGAAAVGVRQLTP
jgi:galactokinase